MMNQTNALTALRTSLKEVEELFKLGAHLGHKKSRLDPKAKKNVYKIINGTSIIDLTKTIGQLEKATNFLKTSAIEGKKILVVGTKKVAATYLKQYCLDNNIAFITSKWLPGLLTNFETLMNNVKKLKSLKADRDSGAWDKLVKHERIELGKQISKHEKLYGGLEVLNGKPDIIVIIDTKKEKNALKEAQTFNIPVVALIDTNSNPERIQYPIVANDDSAQVVEYIMSNILGVYTSSLSKEEKKEEPAAVKKEN